MRKIILALLVLLLASPAMATVTISIADDGNNDGWVTISYAQDDANVGKRPRGFGLDVTCTNDVNICDYDTTGCEPFPIYMGSIVVNAAGTVVNPGTPIAPGGSPGAAGDLGDSAVTIEMGSLYDPLVMPNPNQPALSGDLLRLKVNGSCTMLVTANAPRVSGGVVLEDGTAPGFLPGPGATTSVTVIYGGPDWEEWADPNIGNDASWALPRQCHADADGLQELHPSGKGMVWVGYDDFNILASGFFDEPAVVPAADFDHAAETHPSGKGTVRVGYDDLDVMVAYFLDVPAPPDPDCQECEPASP
jgi:uncharacterized Zn-binding protein involved in type VI secretion